MNRSNRGQRGFSILEVVIGIFIFAVGALALSLLQASLTRGQADANARAVATNIAEQLIERARGFGSLSAPTDPDSNVPSYEGLRKDLFHPGGAALTFDRGGITYAATVDLLDFRWVLGSSTFECFQGEFDNGTDARCITGTPPAGVFSDYKLMEVTVTWAGGEFQLQDGVATSGRLGSGEVLVSGIISSVTTGASARIVTNEDSVIPLPPISYTPGQRPDVIPIQLGDNKFKEALSPVPDVIRDDKVETKFEVVTYSQANDGEATFLRQEEFLAVNCTCTLESGSTQARRPAIWVGDEYGGMQWADKDWGDVPNGVQQSEHCTICCRDHHDGGTASDGTNAPDNADEYANVFGPFKVDNEYAGEARASDHIHYQEDGTTPATTANGQNEYLEACRLVRVAGFWRVAQDFRREDQYVFPEDYFTTDGAVNTYSGYVAGDPEGASGAVVAYFDEAATIGNNYPLTPPCIGIDSDSDGVQDTDCADYPVMGGPYADALESGEFPSWTSLQAGVVVEQQLQSRGIYIDYVQKDLRDYLANCIDDEIPVENCEYGEVELDKTGSGILLEVLPFFDVQLTYLNDWNENPNADPVDVTNDNIESGNTHDRGRAEQTTGYGESLVSALSQRGNTGFTDTFPIEPASVYAGKLTKAYLTVESLDSAGGGGGGGPDPVPQIVLEGPILNQTGDNGAKSAVAGGGGALCDFDSNVEWDCVVPENSTTAYITVTAYGKKNKYRWACISGLTATAVNTGYDVANEASSTFSLDGLPAGSSYTIRIVETAGPVSGC